MDFVDLNSDRDAYDLLQAGNYKDQFQIQSAARYANWLCGNIDARTCTADKGEKSSENRTAQRLFGLIPAESASQMVYTHALPKWLNGSAQWLALRDDGPALRELAERQLQTWTKRQKMCWVTDQSPTPLSLDDLLQRLGLFHFGPLRAGESVVRFCYRLDQNCPSYKPDWRHGFDGFYFASAAAFDAHGMTRSLQDASLACKEWVLATENINVSKHLHTVEVVDCKTDVYLDAPPITYWENLKNEIMQGQRSAVI